MGRRSHSVKPHSARSVSEAQKMSSYGLTRIPSSTSATRELGTQLIKRSGDWLFGADAVARCTQNIHVSHGGRSATSKNPFVSFSDSPLVTDPLYSQINSRPPTSSTFALGSIRSRLFLASR